MELSKEILDYLQRLTVSREYTKRDIADFCGTTRTQISFVLNGHRKPNMKLYGKMVQFAEKAQKEITERVEAEQRVAEKLSA